MIRMGTAIDRAFQGVLRQPLSAEGSQPVNAGAEIDWLDGEKDPALGRQLQHQGLSRNVRTRATTGVADPRARMHIHAPSGRANSTSVSVGEVVGHGIDGVMSTNTTWKVSSFAGRQSLRLSGWHQHLQYFITGFALGKISLA